MERRSSEAHRAKATITSTLFLSLTHLQSEGAKSTLKSIVFFKRKPGLSVEEFRRCRLEQHPALVTALPGVRRCVQDHPAPGSPV